MIQMASRMFENLSAIVQNTLTDSIKMIDIDELHESADNFFVVDRIEEFADTILGQGGVKDNLIVRPLETGGYEIISGHRRRAAVRLLLDYLRGETDIVTVTASSMIDNRCSAHVLEKCGFTLTAREDEDWGFGRPTPADKWICRWSAEEEM